MNDAEQIEDRAQHQLLAGYQSFKSVGFCMTFPASYRGGGRGPQGATAFRPPRGNIADYPAFTPASIEARNRLAMRWMRRYGARAIASRLGWTAVITGALPYANDLLSGDPYARRALPTPGAGWGRICGPTPWPGPPYSFQIHYAVRALLSNSPVCGLGGQSFGNPGSGVNAGWDGPSDGTTRTIYWLWGPNTVIPNRWMVSDQFTRPVGGVVPIIGNPVYPRTGVLSLAGVSPAAAPLPTDRTLYVVPLPLWLVPSIPAATYPEQTTRGDDPPYAGAVPGVVPMQPAEPSTRHQVTVQVHTVPQAVPIRDQIERKLGSETRARRAILFGFRLMSQIGSVNGAVYALWKSMPGNERRRRVGWQRMYNELYHGFGSVQIGDAFANSFMWWVRYRSAGYVSGGAFKQLQTGLGANTGAMFYRAAATAMDQAESTRLRERRRRRRERNGG